MADLGLDGFAIDFVNAEGPVIAYLNQYANMHRAVSLTTAMPLIREGRHAARRH